jgi:hypothetical protein
MPTLNLKATHTVVKDYYDTLKGISTLHLFHQKTPRSLGIHAGDG